MSEKEENRRFILTAKVSMPVAEMEKRFVEMDEQFPDALKRFSPAQRDDLNIDGMFRAMLEHVTEVADKDASVMLAPGHTVELCGGGARIVINIQEVTDESVPD